jgi:hypothetical protein
MRAKHIRFRGDQDWFDLPNCSERSEKVQFGSEKSGQPQKSSRNQRLCVLPEYKK